MTFWLEMHDGESRRLFELSEAEFTIGRGPDNGAVLGDRRSSRRHCRVQVTPQGLLLEDLESRNGTLLNGYAVKKSFVKSGDEFLIGNARFLVREGEGAPPKLDSAVDVKLPLEPPDDARSLTPVQGVTSALEPAAPPAQDAARRQGVTEAKGDGILEESDGILEPVLDSAGDGEVERRPRAATGVKLSLEWLQGPHAGETIVVERTPFVLGRGKDCDLCLRDQRASGRHAQILHDGNAYRLEDLGSTNGTLLNKRPVKQTVLMPGAVLQIGNSSFRVHVPMPVARDVEGQGQGQVEAEEFVPFDAEKFLARDRSEHPATIATVVVIIAILGYFAIDITRRMVQRPEIDPHHESNLLGEHWSFEVAPGDGASGESGALEVAGSVPGWRLRCWTPKGEVSASDGGGSMEIARKGAQPPGRQALRLVVNVSDAASLASRDAEAGVHGGELYRLEGHAVNDGCFAAGLIVEWLRDVRGESVLVERTWSEAARSSGETVDVDLILHAPPGVSRAVVSCVALGSGAAVFDRIALERYSAGDAEEPPAGSERVPETAGLGAEFILEGGPGRERALRLVAEPDGTLSIERSQKQGLVPALWVGHGLERDFYAVGPRLATNRVMTRDRDSILQVGEVPDQAATEWSTIETRVTAKRGDVSVRWRTSGAVGAGVDSGLAFHVEIVEGLVPVELHGDPARERDASATSGDERSGIREMVIGERGERVSFLFETPLRFTKERHPVDGTRVLLVGRTDQPSLELNITRGSRFESVAAREHFRKAEADFRAGRVAEAIAALGRLAELYPAQEAEVRRSRERIAEWRQLAAEAVGKLSLEFQELQRVPNPVVHELLQRRAGEFAERYRATGPGADAVQLEEALSRFWEEREERRGTEELQMLHELGKRHFARNELAQATLYLRWVAEGDPGGEMGQNASGTLELIEGRRKTNLKLFLK